MAENGRIDWADLDREPESPAAPPRREATEPSTTTAPAFSFDVNAALDRLAEILAHVKDISPQLGGKAQEWLAKTKALAAITDQTAAPQPAQEEPPMPASGADDALQAVYTLAIYAAVELPGFTAGQLAVLAERWAPLAANALRTAVEDHGIQDKTAAQLALLIPLFSREIKAYLARLPELSKWTQPESESSSSGRKAQGKRSLAKS